MRDELFSLRLILKFWKCLKNKLFLSNIFWQVQKCLVYLENLYDFKWDKSKKEIKSFFQPIQILRF